MFEKITIHGGAGSLLWGYRAAVVLRAWAITRTAEGWRLTGTVERIDAFQARQRPLLFTAPRAGGFWAWPLIDLQLGETQIAATLGPPEQ